jgi:hypothetical protein
MTGSSSRREQTTPYRGGHDVTAAKARAEHPQSKACMKRMEQLSDLPSRILIESLKQPAKELDKGCMPDALPMPSRARHHSKPRARRGCLVAYRSYFHRPPDHSPHHLPSSRASCTRHDTPGTDDVVRVSSEQGLAIGAPCQRHALGLTALLAHSLEIGL